MTRRYFRYPTAIPLALAAAWLFAACGSGVPPSRAVDNEKGQGQRPVRVETVSEGRLPRTVTVTGTLSPDVELPASFKVAGRVAAIEVDLGSTVRKGQTIARLDPTDFRHRVAQSEAALRQVRASLGLRPDGAEERVDPEATAQVREARAVLDEARLSRDRMSGLLEKGFISRAEFDASLSRLQVAEGRHQAAVEEVLNRLEILSERRSALALARQQLDDATLRSPIDGAVRERIASVGVYIEAGSPVVALVRVHPLRLRVSVPERDAISIRVGQPVLVHTEGDANGHAGRVTRISPAIREQNRTLAIEAEIANPGGLMRPGAFAKAEIVVEAAKPAILAPASSIVTFAGIEKVFGVSGGKAVEKPVRTGRRSGDRVEILEGLAPGDPVVIDPGNLSGGQPVAIRR